MDENLEILLGSAQNVNSVNVDNYQLIELENKPAQIYEYDIRNALSATEIFDAEREANDTYRIYGRIEYLSLLNGLKLDYVALSNFFLQQTTNSKNIFNSFKFYLVKAASSGYTNISGNTIVYFSGLTGTTSITEKTLMYSRRFEVIATPSNFELYNAGFTNNVYGDQVYAFNFNKDFNVDTYVDNFGFPATELFLYAEYQPARNGAFALETMFRTFWGTNGIAVKQAFTPTTLSVGDKIYGDLVEYAKSIYFQEQLRPQLYYINTPILDGVLQWKYNPLIPLRLKYFYSNVSVANTGSTSYAQSSTIPYYATSLGDGNYVWREIIPQGLTDPLTGLGVDYPFINKKRYLFSPIVLDVSSNLNDTFTFDKFTQIKFGPPTLLNTSPNTDLGNIGKPCL